ncbi:hypothetical protein [Aquimarina sp. 2201CG5-10]|uniref:hypothetical protein n=1 Tax=Aquimarina callyspongiae TaxID=3098150 RepID=UPI002AB4BD2C|nr:hypothetical protein [Aquimarina sp. 2201CG5-10]MDY8136569.1 hypothetical protein [Aquimarina sp. 2201CG5-10]
MKLKNLAFVSILLLSISTTTGQWSKGKKNGYYKLSAWSLVSDQHYTDTGNIDPNATRGFFNLNFYGEYGITDKLDIIAYVPFFSRTYQNDQISGTTGEVIQQGEDLNGIGDSDISIRYGILQKNNFAIATTLKLGLPIGNDSGGSDGSFQTGDGEFNQHIQLDFGIPFTIKKTPLYAKTYFGYNNRTQDFSDELHFGGETGISFWNKKIWLIGRLNAVQSLQNGDKSAQNAQGSIFANNIEYTSVGGEIAYYITKKFGISFTYTSTISGRIIYANPSISGGIFLNIKKQSK